MSLFSNLQPHNFVQVAPIAKRNVFLNTKPSIEAAANKYNENNMQIPKVAYSFPPVKEMFVTPEKPNDIVYNNSRPVYLLLRIMGAMPFTHKSAGMSKFEFMSPQMGYSAIIYFGLVGYVIYVALNRMDVVRSLEGRFEEAVIAYLFLVNLLPVLIVPIIWYETKKIVRVLNNWNEFEVLYYNTSQRALPLNLSTKSLIVAIGLPILTTISVVVTHVTMVHFQVSQVIPYCFLDTLTYMMGAFWFLECETLISSASILADDFQRALHHIGPAGMVANYRALWLRLSKLARDIGTGTCYTFTFINLYLFFIITLSIYGLMSQLSDGFGIKDIGLFVTASCSICLLFFICDEAHSASQHVRTNFQKKLLMVELSWMNTDAQTEINMFLRATEMNPSDINLGGFFDVNRNLFKSLLTTMVTYLVVLLQFQISIPEDTVGLKTMGNGTDMPVM